ncbi:unnamed protein product [Durusdinium trenchii]|uniref:Uncharacterized protein n=1 Tax=Durusdinium trenchii TaxID=1381693 RepID=A0ABP0NYY3_9DINO
MALSLGTRVVVQRGRSEGTRGVVLDIDRDAGCCKVAFDENPSVPAKVAIRHLSPDLDSYRSTLWYSQDKLLDVRSDEALAEAIEACAQAEINPPRKLGSHKHRRVAMAIRITLLLLLPLAGASLLEAVKKGDLKDVKKALASEASEINEQDENGMTPLMRAGNKNSTEMVKAILAKNPDLNLVKKALAFEASEINEQDENGVTPLMRAANKNSTEMVKAILT